MYAVIHKDSGGELSYHNTLKGAQTAVAMYNHIDWYERNYDPDQYDIIPIGDDQI